MIVHGRVYDIPIVAEMYCLILPLFLNLFKRGKLFVVEMGSGRLMVSEREIQYQMEGK